MAEDLTPPEIPESTDSPDSREPSEAEVQSIMDGDDLLEYRSSNPSSLRRKSMFQFYKDQWKAQRAFEERSKEVEAARNTVNAELAEQSDKPAEKSDVDKAVESIEERRVQSPEEQSAILSEERQQNPPVGYRYIEIGSANKNESDTDWRYNEREAPRAYQIANDIANAAAIAQAAEEARQEVIKRYREEEEKAKSETDASGQAALLQQREKMREEDRRRADLRKQEKLVERQEALGSRSYQGPFDMLDAAADENARQRVRERYRPKQQEKSKPSHNISRILAGGLFALFFGSLIQALTVFGVIAMNSGHVFMIIAFIAGALLLTTEILPVKPRKHKILSVLILGLVLLAIDLASVWYVTKEKPESKPQIVNVIPAPTPVPSPKLLHDYFIEEIYQSATDEIPLKIKVKGKDIPVEARIYMNFNNKSVFLGFYIPETEHTTEVCQHLLRGHTGVLAAFVQLLQDQS